MPCLGCRKYSVECCEADESDESRRQGMRTRLGASRVDRGGGLARRYYWIFHTVDAFVVGQAAMAEAVG